MSPITALAVVLLVPPAIAGPAPSPVEPDHLLGSTGAVGASLVDIDPATGGATLRFPLGDFGPVTEIEYRTDGTLFGSTGGGTRNILTLDPDTGVETLVGQHAIGSVNGLEFVGDVLYGSYLTPTPEEGGEATFLVIVDQTDGSLTILGEMGHSPVRGLAYDEEASTMYGVGTPPPYEGQGDAIFTVDLATGATTTIGSTASLGALELGPDGVLYGGGNQAAGEGQGSAALYTVDPVTGAATAVGPTGFPAISGLAFAPSGRPSAVEIPALSGFGLPLMGLTLTAAAILALRRR
jgi:hypothetical protein